MKISKKDKNYLKQFDHTDVGLKLDYFSHQKEVGIDQRKMTFHFSQPMVTFEELNKKKPSVDFIQFFPELYGSYHWLTPTTLIFESKESLKKATEYEVHIKAGATSLLGYAFLKDVIRRFSTPRPEVVKIEPNDGTLDVLKKQVFKVFFNQSISPKKNEKLISIESQGKLVKVDAYCAGIKNHCQEVLVEPLEEVPFNTKFILRIRKGIIGNEGHLLSLKEKSVSYQTHNRFSVLDVKCDKPCVGKTKIKVLSTTPLNTKNITKFLKFNVNQKEALLEYKSQKTRGYFSETTFTGNFPPKANLSLIVQKGIHDVYDQELKEEIKFSFETDHLKPSWKWSSSEKESYSSLQGVNLGLVKAFSRYLDIKELIRLNQDPNLFFNKANKTKTYWDFEIEQKFTEDDQEVLLKFKDEKRPIRKGLIARLDGFTSEFLGEDHPVWKIRTVSNLKPLLNIHDDNGVLFLFHNKLKRPVPFAKVEVYHESGRKLYEWQTNAKGFVEFAGAKSLLQKAYLGSVKRVESLESFYFVFTYQGKQSFLKFDYEPLVKNKKNIFVTKSEEIKSFLIPNKLHYKVGDEVKLKAFIRKQAFGKLKKMDSPFTVLFLDPDKRKVLQRNVIPNSRGNLYVSFRLPVFLKSGTYEIAIEGEKGDYLTHNSIKVTVGDYKMPLEREKNEYQEIAIPEKYKAKFIKMNKQDLKLGDVFEVEIKAPFEKSKGIIFIERNGVVESFYKPKIDNNTKVSFVINENHIPNFFVRAVLWNDNQDVLKKYVEEVAEYNFKPQLSESELDIKLDKDEFLPGEQLDIVFQINTQKGHKAAEITFLALKKQKEEVFSSELVNPTGYFFERIYDKNQVQFFDYKQKAHDPENTTDEHMESKSQFRKLLSKTIYFESNIETNHLGEVALGFRLPQIEGEYLLLAIANTDQDQFLVSKKEISVKHGLQAKLKLPRVLNIGDQLDLVLEIKNNTKEINVVDYRMKIPFLENDNFFEEKINLDVNSKFEKQFHIKLNQKDLVQYIEENFQEQILQNEIELPIYVDLMKSDKKVISFEFKTKYVFQNQLDFYKLSGVIKEKKHFKFSKNKNAVKPFGTFEFYLAANYMGKFVSILESWEQERPVDIFEQLNFDLPYLLLKKNDALIPEYLIPLGFNEKQIDLNIQKIVELLKSHYAFEDYTSFMILCDYLFFLKKSDFDVDDHIQALKSELHKKFHKMSLNKKTASYMFNYYYALSRFQKAPQEELDLFVKFKDKLSELQKVQLVEMIAKVNSRHDYVIKWKQGIYDEFIDIGHPKKKSSYNKLNIEYLLAVLRSMVLCDFKVEFVHDFTSYILSRNNSMQKNYPLSIRSKLLRILWVLQEEYPLRQKDLTARIYINDQEIMTSKMSLTQPADKLILPLSKLPDDFKIRVEKVSGDFLFFDFRMKQLNLLTNNYPIVEGIEVKKTFYSEHGLEIDDQSFESGKRYKVEISFFLNEDTRRLVLNDSLVSGFDLANQYKQLSLDGIDWKMNQKLFGNSYIRDVQIHNQLMKIQFVNVPKGLHKLYYYVDAKTDGLFTMTPVTIYNSYKNHVFGQGESGQLKIEN